MGQKQLQLLHEVQLKKKKKEKSNQQTKLLLNTIAVRDTQEQSRANKHWASVAEGKYIFLVMGSGAVSSKFSVN